MSDVWRDPLRGVSWEHEPEVEWPGGWDGFTYREYAAMHDVVVAEATAARPPLPSRAVLARINLCPYRECPSGCARSKCWAKRAGLQWGAEPYTSVTLADCAGCLRGAT